jgi:Zn-dependent protease
MLSLISNPVSFVVYLFALLSAITIHEFSHALAAEKLGDPTPSLQGRISLNPLRHLDPFGMLFLFMFGFGWGKPVMFDPYNLKNPRRDAALIGLAGPVSNLLLALALSILARLFIVSNITVLAGIGLILFTPMIMINVTLAIFNLLPIHPLDGFKIVGGFLPHEKAREWYALERYGFIFLLLLILPLAGNGSMLDIVMRPIASFVIHVLVPSSAGGFI